MEVGQGPNWGCSAKEKKFTQLNSHLMRQVSVVLWVATGVVFLYFLAAFTTYSPMWPPTGPPDR
jgi:hypothetical protein